MLERFKELAKITNILSFWNAKKTSALKSVENYKYA